MSSETDSPMLTIKAMNGAKDYATRHLACNDYYSQHETVHGVWIGEGAKMLGLQGLVQGHRFEAIREVKHPFTGEKLRPRSSEINLYDMCLSAPKPVSALGVIDSRLANCHRIAVTDTVKEIEYVAQAYVRIGGTTGSRNTSNLIIARFEHDTSRELDPQLHTHLVAANMTFDQVEQRWKCLNPQHIYNQCEYFTEFYRNSLAREIKACGYQIEPRMKAGKDNGFNIEGVPESLIQKFSQRSAQRDEAIAEFRNENHREPTNKEIAKMVRDTRSYKLTEISTAEVKAKQLARITPYEMEVMKGLMAHSLEVKLTLQPKSYTPSVLTIKQATEQIRQNRGYTAVPTLTRQMLINLAKSNHKTQDNYMLPTSKSIVEEITHDISQQRGHTFNY